MTAMQVNQIIDQLNRLDRMSDLDAKDFAEEEGMADSLAIQMKKELNPTQLRKVFSEIKRIRRNVEGQRNPDQPFDRTVLVNMMPTLAYSVGRDLLPNDFYKVMKIILSKERVQTNNDFLRSADFIEAVLAYQKYHQNDKDKGN